MFSKKRLQEIPKNPGVYLFKDKLKKVIYVGKALSLRDRVASYFQSQKSLKNLQLIKQIADFSFIEVNSEVEALILEANLIKKYLPRFNINLRDDKSFLYIGISKEEFPRVLAFRKNDKKNKFIASFGPFPSASSVRLVLKLIRRIFPYCTQSPNIKHPCFYSHIGLCSPCPAAIKKLPNKEYKILKNLYLKNIIKIRKILQGRISSLVVSLTKEMELYSKNLDYEKARNVKNQILALEYITKPYYKISSFLENPNFLEEEKSKSIKEVYNLLKPYFPHLTIPERIEGVDISNIMGNNATGSLVVFVNGVRRTDLYKRFKITSSTPNDVLMIKEVLERRMRHNDWGLPNLILIDGGKPQVSIASKIVKNIPIIGLAKRLETIVVPLKNNKFVEISLKRSEKALKLIQEVRDEAHRFAKSYHKLLRQKVLKGSIPERDCT